MFSLLLCVIFCGFLTQSAFAIKCFGTDMKKLIQYKNLRNTTQNYQNCEVHLNEFIPNVKNASTFSCYALEFAGETQKVKTCFQPDECDFLKRAFLYTFPKYTIENVKCWECTTDGCNSGWSITGPGLNAFILINLVLRF